MNDLQLPPVIQRAVSGKPYQTDGIGESGALVLLFDDMALKIEKTSRSSDNEYMLLCWLDGKLPTPRVIAFARENGFNYLLMTRLTGEMACSDECMRHPEAAVDALADGLKMLWKADIAGCPVHNGLDEKLSEARRRMDAGLVSFDRLNPDTLAPGGFADMEALYAWLLSNRPEEDLVFSHGDYCLPNVFIANGTACGFLDLGSAGVADRWQDIALCVRSMEYNLVYRHRDDDTAFARYRERFFQRLGLRPDADKIRYYILLDEFF